jgi:hypothetical protein
VAHCSSTTAHGGVGVTMAFLSECRWPYRANDVNDISKARYVITYARRTKRKREMQPSGRSLGIQWTGLAGHSIFRAGIDSS